MELSSCFFPCSLRKPIVSYWFENILLELFSLQLCLFLFYKMMKFYKAIWNFFSWINVNMRHKNIIGISSINWNVLLWIFWDCLIFDGNPTDFYNSFFKKIAYTLSVMLPTSNDAFWKNLIWIKPATVSHHLKIQSLSLEKDLTIGMFTIWESLFPNHESEGWILRHISIYFLKFL